MRSMARLLAPVVAATALAGLIVAPAHATETIPATGRFSFTTANGILPTWTSEQIALVGVSPGSVTTAANATNARVTVPIIAKTGTANAAGGGFRLLNADTGEVVRCSTPTIDTRARLVDCVLADGTNAALFTITEIATRSRVIGSTTITRIFRGVQLRLNGQEAADLLNEELSTTTFSPYVIIGTGDLIVTYDKP